MFGRFGQTRALEQYREGMAAAETLPWRDVTAEEFMRLASGENLDDESVARTARISKAMGSHVRIGDELLRVVDGD